MSIWQQAAQIGASILLGVQTHRLWVEWRALRTRRARRAQAEGDA